MMLFFQAINIRSLFFIGFLFIISSLRADYCIPNFVFGPVEGDYIDGVELGAISNFTGAGSDWNDYTDLIAAVNPGLVYNLLLHNTPSYSETYAAWIDWNQDEIFNADERLNLEDIGLSPGETGTISFTVPFSAMTGITRMRIVCSYYPGGLLEPCFDETYNWGEVEDYSINVLNAGPKDLGVTGIIGISDGCGLGATAVTVNISNFGTDPSGSFSVAYQLTDPILGVLPLVTQSYTGPIILPLATSSFTFSLPVDLSNIGDYTLHAYTIYAPDAEPLNNASDITFTSITTLSAFPYFEDFEDGSSDWQAGGSESTWELGSPAGTAITGPPPLTPLSINSWVTSLSGNYNLNEKSFVESPCFDFSSLTLPFIEFDINYDAQLFDDGTKLQYSINGGDSWFDVGNIGTGENWYNHNSCFAMYPVFYIDNYNGWSGNSGGWLHAYQNLAFLAGEASVKLRIVFASSNFWNFNEGFAFDNVLISDPFTNDVGVSEIVSPETSPSLTASEAVSVELTNFGTLPQTNFNVSYKINGGAIISQLYTSTLSPGASDIFTFSVSANLSADGDYNFKSWTNLASDANVTNDTIIQTISNLMPLTGTAAYYVYSSITGFEPFNTVSNDMHLDAVFGVGGWNTAFFETVDIDVLFGPGTCFVYLDGSDLHADELELFLNTHITQIQNWVSSGGHLLINSAPNEGDGMSLGFGGTLLYYPWETYDILASDPLQPVWFGPYSPVSTSMSGTPFGKANIIGTALTPIIYDALNPDKIILAEKYWGAGLVIFGAMTPTDFHSPTPQVENLRKNLFSYLAICTISNNDVGVQTILNPKTDCGLTNEETISVTIRNYGFVNQSNIPLNYSINGGSIITEIYSGPLAIGSTIDYTFITPVDLSAISEYTLKAWTSLATDTILSNDSTSTQITNIPVISTFPYVQNWESGEASGWLISGVFPSWELGSPAGPVINTSPTETPGSAYSWTTSLAGNYNNGEMSYLESPCFNLSDLTVPYLEFDLWWETETDWDGLQLQYSMDGGATWFVLGDIGTGANWYSGESIALGFQNGWVGSSAGWRTAHQEIAFLAGESDVKFRYYFASDLIFSYDGIGLDNFRLQDPFPNDLGATYLSTPLSGTNLTTSEIISVNIHNFGLLPQTLFPVSYQLDAGAIITETFPGTINPSEDAIFTFATSGDFSAIGAHELCAWTSLAIDEDISNDEISGCATVYNLLPVSGTSAYYIYSNAVGYEPGYLNSNTEAMNAVFGEDAWFLDFYESINPLELFSETNCFIFLEASEYHWSEFETFFNANKSLIEGWVASGGNLLINASPLEGDGGDIGFGGVTIEYPWFTYNSEPSDPLHPILNGPFLPVTANLNGFYIGRAKTSGVGISPIINDAFCSDCYILSEKTWGNGKVIFGNMEAPEYYAPTLEAQNLRQNIITNLRLCAPVDIGVSELLTPIAGCDMTEDEIVSVVITNYGLTTVTNTSIQYQLDFASPITEIAPGPIPIGGSYTYTFDTHADFSSPGIHILKVWSDFDGDVNVLNDSITINLESLETPQIEFGPTMTICDEIILDAENSGSNYLWSTGETTQNIAVNVSGNYSVTITNPSTGCIAFDQLDIIVNYTPNANFTTAISGLNVDFTNLSTADAVYNWNFGDGAISMVFNPTHSYASLGTYTVTLTVTNGCGSDYYTFVLTIGNAIDNILNNNLIEIYPNPVNDFAYLNFHFNEPQFITLELINVTGEILLFEELGIIQNNLITINLNDIAAGIYQLKINTQNGIISKQIIKTI